MSITDALVPGLPSLLRITIAHGYIVQILLAEALFTYGLRRRSHAVMRAIFGFVVALPLMVAVPNWISGYVSGLFSLTVFLLSLMLWRWMLEGSFRELLFCCVGAQLTQNLSYNVENLIYRPFADRIPDVGWFALSVGCTCVVYAICFLLFARRPYASGHVEVEGRYVYTFAVMAALFTYVMQYLFQVYGLDRYWVSRPPLILCCLAGLCVQYGFVALKSESDERAMLERMMRQEARQYAIAQESVDLINMKAHDLKHQIARIRATGNMDDAELNDIERIVARYEDTCNSGNRDLDVVLAQKQMVCRSEGIVMTVIAQGEALTFMRPSDIASLFGNILDNAIEHERTVEPPSLRTIAVSVRRNGNMSVIRIENYCARRPRMVGGLPVTSKNDRRYHGFGMRSVRYIVERYGGSLAITTEGDLFVVSILLPYGNERVAAR